MSLIQSKSYYSTKDKGNDELLWIDKLKTSGVVALSDVIKWKNIYQNYSIDTWCSNSAKSTHWADRFNQLFISVRKVLFIRNIPAHPTRNKIFRVEIGNKLDSVYDFEKFDVKAPLKSAKDIIEYVKRIKNAIEKVKIK